MGRSPRAERTGGPPGLSAVDMATEVHIGKLPGDLVVPTQARALILFAHGSGSSRHSVRNRGVAHALHRHRLGTLLFDLLDETEAQDRRQVFDIPLLGSRLVQAIDWAALQPAVAGLPLGLFGASTGAAAALLAASRRGGRVGAVVSRGGRPDLALDALPDVHAPTLLIVGSEDQEVLALNHAAARLLGGPQRLEVIAGATHLFEEPGALEHVAALAAAWFETHLAAPASRPPGR